jgi:hypothetical protein
MEVVEHEHIDLVVISTHGISGWHPLVFGSIAEKVVKLVQCPLLLLRSAKPDAKGKISARQSTEDLVSVRTIVRDPRRISRSEQY